MSRALVSDVLERTIERTIEQNIWRSREACAPVQASASAKRVPALAGTGDP